MSYRCTVHDFEVSHCNHIECHIALRKKAEARITELETSAANALALWTRKGVYCLYCSAVLRHDADPSKVEQHGDECAVHEFEKVVVRASDSVSAELKTLAAKAVESQKAREGEDVEAWAEKLAADSVAIGEQDARAAFRTSKATPDRGRYINEHATIGMRLTQLRAELSEVEKQARKTPRKDLLDEVAKVHNARARVPNIKREIASLETEHAGLRVLLVRLGHFAPADEDPHCVGKQCGECMPGATPERCPLVQQLERVSSEASPGHGEIVLPYRPTEDTEITCIRCGQGPCAFEIEVRREGGKSWSGVCAACRSVYVTNARPRTNEAPRSTAQLVSTPRPQDTKCTCTEMPPGRLCPTCGENFVAAVNEVRAKTIANELAWTRKALGDLLAKLKKKGDGYVVDSMISPSLVESAQEILRGAPRPDKAMNEVEDLRAKVRLLKGLIHSELLTTMHYCETCEMAYQRPCEVTDTSCPYCELHALREARMDYPNPKSVFDAGFVAGMRSGTNQCGQDEGYPYVPDPQTADEAFEEWRAKAPRSDSSKDGGE